MATLAAEFDPSLYQKKIRKAFDIASRLGLPKIMQARALGYQVDSLKDLPKVIAAVEKTCRNGICNADTHMRMDFLIEVDARLKILFKASSQDKLAWLSRTDHQGLGGVSGVSLLVADKDSDREKLLMLLRDSTG